MGSADEGNKMVSDAIGFAAGAAIFLVQRTRPAATTPARRTG